MLVRYNFLSTDDAHSTWKWLEPFFRLPGHVVDAPERFLVYLRPFNDRN
jgi:hypothetical protein